MAKFLDKTGLDTFWAKIKSTFQTLGNLVTAWGSTPSDTKYPSEKLVKDSLDAKVSSIKKNETSITPTNGVVDIGYMPTTKEVESGSVQDTIQALRVVPGGAMGSVNLTASTVDSMSIPAGWYNYIWIPHRSGQSSSDTRNYGTLILTPMTTTPDEYIVEGSALGGSSPVYKARRMEQMNNKVSSWSSTTNNTRYPSEKLVKDYVDGKSWFKNTSNAGMQNSNAYYQCISAQTADFSGLVKLYDVTEFFDGTIVNQNERSVFFGDVSLIRDSGNAGCKYARVCAMIGYNTADSNIILQSDDDNAYPILVKENFDRMEPTYTIGAYVISNGVATLDSSLTRSKFAIISCSGQTNFYINAGYYNPSGYGLSHVKAYIFTDDSFNVIGNATGTNFDGFIDVPSGATKLIVHTNNSYYLSVGPATTHPKYFLAMRYAAGWPAGTIEYFGRFYTRLVANESYSARPLLLTYIQNLAPVGASSLPSGYVVQKSATYTTHSAVTDKLFTARKLKTNLARTADSTFDGSADQTNIPVTGTLPVANGGTGATTAKGASYNINAGMNSGDSDAIVDTSRFAFNYSSPSATTGGLYYRTAPKVWDWIKGKISSVLGLTETSYGGNAATATALASGSADRTKLDGIAEGAEVNVQSDWNQATTTADDYIKNKPTLGTAASKDVATSGNASTTQVVMGNDTRLTDSRTPTSHASSETTYGVGTTSNYGHVKLATGDMNGATHSDGVAVSKNHTHSQYLTSHQSITGKMDTDASNATTGSGTGAAPTLLEGMAEDSDPITSDDVFIPTTDSAGTANGKWYKRKISKLWSWIISHTQSLILKASDDVYWGVGADSTHHIDLDYDDSSSSPKMGLWVRWGSGSSNAKYMAECDTSGNCRFNGSSESVVGIDAGTRNTSTYRLSLGYTTSLKYDGHARAIVTLHSDSDLGDAGSGIGVTILVSVDWKGNSTNRHVSARVLNNDAFAADILPGVLVFTDDNGMLHFYVVLLGRSSNSANYELKPFNYTSTDIIKLGGTMNWAWDIQHDSVSTISSSDFVFPAEDCVTHVCQPPSSVIGSGSPAADCKAYWTNFVGKGCVKTVYNNNGQEYILLFSKSANGRYGTILRWSYRGPSASNISRIEMLRCHNNNWLTSDWQGLSVDYATNATNAGNADTVDGKHVVFGAYAGAANTIYFG